MKATILSALVVITAAGASWAQQAPTDAQPPTPPKTEDQLQPQQPPSPPPPMAARDNMGAPDAMWPHDRGGPPHGDHGGHWPPPPPPMSKAAHFHIQDRGRNIDVKCADDEPTKVCADTVLEIIEKLGPAYSRPGDYRD